MFVIKQNDTLPKLECQILDPNNNPFDLELCTVKFHMVNTKNEVVISRLADILNSKNGKVGVTWKRGDTEVVGFYKCEFEIELPTGDVLTIPNDGYLSINIIPELN